MKNNWEEKKLADVCEIKPQKKEAREKLKDDDLVTFLPMEDLGIMAKDFVASKERPLREVSGSYTYFAENDVLLAKITPCFENGKIGIARNLTNGIGFGSSEYIVFRTNDEIIPDYLYYFLSREQFREEGKKAMTGAVGHKRVSKDFIDNYLLPFPKSLTEQQRIVAILDEAFAAIAQAKENAEKNLQNAREIFDSYLQSIFANPGDDWEVKTLNQISENLDSKRIPITKSVRSSGSIPYYGASGIVDYVADYIFDDDLLLVSEDGANLLARTYPIAFSISGKTWVNNHAHVLRFEKIESQIFVELYLNSIKLDDYVSGMAQPKLNQAMLNKIPIPYPSIEEQKMIVGKLSAISVETKKLENIYRQKINDLDELKKSILQKAFSGELTAKRQVSNVIDFPVRIPNISATDLQAGIVALAFERHQQKGNVLTFGHVKAEKIVHLAQEVLNIELEREPVKDAAGPNDFPRLIKVESRAEKAGFFKTVKQGYGYTYIQGNQFDNLIEKTKTALNDKADELTNLIDLLVPMDTQQAELVATVYAAWNNLLIDNQTINDEAIVSEARENWHEAKLNIPRDRFFERLNWMKENNIIPKGKGKKVLARSAKV
jgi:type I restriction enzyme S subunit